MSSCPAKPSLNFFATPHAPYYVLTPVFTQKSAGQRALHYLCHILNELGYEAYACACSSEQTNPHLRTPLLTQEIVKRHRDAGRVPIAVYPEVVPGNPFNQDVVARWLLNRAGHLKGHKDFAPDELTFYWHELFLDGEKNAEKLFVPVLDRRIFNSKGASPENRQGFCYYAHKYLMKGGKVAEHLLQNGISLCQDIPRSPEEIAQILRASRVLYCYEPSAIGGEALLCGCPVVTVMTDYLRQFDLSAISSIPGVEFLTATEAEIASPDFSIPAVDSRAYEDYLDANEQESLACIARFIEITQDAAKAHAEKPRDSADWLERGISAFQTNNFGMAIEIFSDLLEKEAQNPLPSAYLAFIAARQGLFAEAEDFIAQSARIAPQRADLKAAMGEVFLTAGEAERACHHLNEAVLAQPDLLGAYPALAKSLHQTQQSEAAISLLQSALSLPSPAQTEMREILLEILAQRGDLAEFAQDRQRFSRGMIDDLLAAHCFSHFEASGENFLATLGRIQERLAKDFSAEEIRKIQAPEAMSSTKKLLKIAFLLGDCKREASMGRLPALLRDLPPEKFTTLLILAEEPSRNDNRVFTSLCMQLADQVMLIAREEDAVAREKIRAAAPDFLIDLDAYGPAERLAIFLRAEVNARFLWGEAPMPPLSPDCRILAGEALAVSSLLPTLELPGLGEFCDLPEIPIEPRQGPGSSPVLACLTPAERIGREGWQLFAELLAALPESSFLLNLGDLGEAAQMAICGRFARAGVLADRLRFVHARTAKEFCRLWQETDLGLAPPVDAGGLALPSCLWMGRPYLSLASPLPWAHRPAALLECVGAQEWIVENVDAYIERACNPPHSPDPSFRTRLQAAGLTNSTAFAHGFATTILSDQ
ncbi:MAG: hypothetical protein LBO00_05635 [Zoogloeaceae bacterium]|nr:hypothetical protein [Zoogloeaceae bacterium]